MTQNFENVFYFFSSVEWHQLSTASASKRLHTLVTRSLQLGCKRPSEKTMAIFFALVFFEHESVFGDAEQGRRAFLDLKQDVKSLFNRLHGLYHCPTVECLPENPTQVDFFCDGKHISRSILACWAANWCITIETKSGLSAFALNQLCPPTTCGYGFARSLEHGIFALGCSKFCFKHFYLWTCFLSCILFESCSACLWGSFLCVNDNCFWGIFFLEVGHLCLKRTVKRVGIPLNLFTTHPNRFHWHWLIRNSLVLRLPRNLLKDLHPKD